jgi:ankyrin repeat protein
VFAYAAWNGNLDNMKWLLANKFPYDKNIFMYASRNGNPANIKWLLDNGFLHGNGWPNIPLKIRIV